MTTSEALKKYHKIEIELLLAHVLKKPKEFLYLNDGYKLSRIQADKLSRMARRREKGEPMAYILGYRDFFGLRFKVNKNVLIPRPETEVVIERLKDLRLKDIKSHIRILDVGTGSGCIAVALAKQFSFFIFQFSITASDISKKALAVARQNAKINRVKVKFIHSDLLKNIKGDFDIITANLPYGWNVWKNNSSLASIGLKFEPKRALFTQENGLKLIKKLLAQIAQRKNKPKLIFFEFDPRQKKDMHRFIRKYLPKAEVKFYKDYAGLWRCAEIKLN